MWRFTIGTKVALSKIKVKGDAITKLAVYRQHADQCDPEEWLVPAAAALAQRQSSITVDEARRMGCEYTAKIAQIREAVTCPLGCMPAGFGAYTPHTVASCPSRANRDFTPTVRRIFQIPDRR